MKRQHQQLFAAGLILLCGARCLAQDTQFDDVGRRELKISNAVEAQPRSAMCRCEYPGEGIYDVNEPDTGKYITVGGYVVFPSTHEACIDLWFFCPGVEFSNAIPWQYQCPSDDPNSDRKLLQSARYRGNLRHIEYQDENEGRSLSTTTAGENYNPFPDEFHHLLDGPKQEFYTYLPADHEFCASGGTRIRSGEAPNGSCASKTLSFTKAGNRRLIPGGAFVANEWFPNLGVKISASSDGGLENMHPMVFDMTNPGANGVGKYLAAELAGHDELGNVLVARRAKGVVGSVDDFGMLNFEFFEQTYVNFITLLNVDDNCRVFVTQGDGNVSVFEVKSAGRGGLRNVKIDLEDVLRITVSFKNFAAVVSMDLCLNRLHDV